MVRNGSADKVGQCAPNCVCSNEALRICPPARTRIAREKQLCHSTPTIRLSVKQTLKLCCAAAPVPKLELQSLLSPLYVLQLTVWAGQARRVLCAYDPTSAAQTKTRLVKSALAGLMAGQATHSQGVFSQLCALR